MPELPEVETVARSLRPRLVGRTIDAVETSGLALRRPIDEPALATACCGASVNAVRRVGKYLLIDLSPASPPAPRSPPRARTSRSKGAPSSVPQPVAAAEHVLLVHLGMTGRLVVVASTERRPPHTHAIFRLRGGGELRFVDPRRFGLVLLYPAATVAACDELVALGPDPLGPDFTLAAFTHALGRSRRDIKTLLLDQTVVAGLGNIYVCEALFRARIAPTRPADRIGPARARRLHDAVRAVLASAVAHRGTTFRDYVDGGGEPGGNQLHLDVYGREDEPCSACGRPVRRIVQGGRSTFFCSACQR